MPSSGSATSRIRRPATNNAVKRRCVMSVHLAVPIRSTARVHVELAAEAIHLPLQIAVFDFRRQPASTALEVEIAEDQPAQMRRMRDAAGRGKVRERADDDDEIFRPEWER